MKTRMKANISPAAIAVALFCAVAVLAPTPTITITKDQIASARGFATAFSSETRTAIWR